MVVDAALSALSYSRTVSISITSAWRLTHTKSSVESSEPQCDVGEKVSLPKEPRTSTLILPTLVKAKKEKHTDTEPGQFDLWRSDTKASETVTSIRISSLSIV